MNGSEQYNKVLGLVNELKVYDRKPVEDWEEGCKLFEKEEKVLLEMQKYLNTRLLKVREVNEGYTFSMTDGKDGKPTEPSDKAENRFKIMVQSYEKLSNRIMEHAAKYRPGLLEFNKNAYGKILNPTYHINVKTNVKPDPSVIDSYETLQSYETQRRTDLKKLAVKKEISFRQQKEREKQPYEFKGSIYSRELTDSIYTSIYAANQKEKKVPYAMKEFLTGKQEFVEKIKKTGFDEEITSTVKLLLDPVSNESKDFFEAKIDEKAVGKMAERAYKSVAGKGVLTGETAPAAKGDAAKKTAQPRKM